MNISRLFPIGFCLLLAACGSSSDEPAAAGGTSSSNNAGSNNSNNGGSSNNGSDDAGAPGGSSNDSGASDGGEANEGGAENGGSSNVDPNEVPTGNSFIATGTWDGEEHEFACDAYETLEGGIASFTEITPELGVFAVQCRSTDGTHQIRLGILDNEPIGEPIDYIMKDGGVLFAPIDGQGASGYYTTVQVDSITLEAMTSGESISGSFEAEWDEGPGDDFMSGPAASCSGVFSAEIQ